MVELVDTLRQTEHPQVVRQGGVVLFLPDVLAGGLTVYGGGLVVADDARVFCLALFVVELLALDDQEVQVAALLTVL